jgi:EmrB/QacA subfamily drug resistance transporter
VGRPSPRDKDVLVVYSGLLLAMFVGALDQTVVANSLPSIVDDLGGLMHLSWVVTAYVLAISLSTPIYGKLGDLFGRKRLFQFALIMFLTGSVLCGTSQSMTALIVFRAIQGLGAGGMMVNSQAMVGDLVPAAERGRYQGPMQSVFALATIFGPLLGGALTQYLGWRWVFYINVPFCLLALLVVTTRFKAPVREPRRPRIDWWGTILLCGGVTSLILVTTWGGNTYSWTSVPIIGCAVAVVVLLTAFVVVERRVPEPVLPLRLFGNGIIRVVSPLAFVVGFTTLGATIFVPLFQQTVDGVSPTMSGLRMAPLWLAWAATSAISGRHITRSGRYRRLPVAGTFLLASAMFTLSRLDVGDSYAFQAVALAAVGTGLGMISSVMVLAAQNAADPKDLGVATSTTTFSRTIGASLGVAVFGAIFAGSLRQTLPADMAQRVSGRGLDMSHDQVAAMPASMRADFLHGFESSLHNVFLTGAGLAVIAFALALNLRNVPLRRRATAAAISEPDEKSSQQGKTRSGAEER